MCILSVYAYMPMYRNIYICNIQDGVCSPEDVDTAVTEGLGLRYAFSGPLETMHLNANGVCLFH